MARHGVRVFVAALAALGLALVAVAVATEFRGTATASSDHTVEILDDAFNPQLCIVNRNGDRIFWRNESNVVRRIILPTGNPTSPFDTGDLEPGETSTRPFQVQSILTLDYTDEYDESLTGTIQAPFDQNAAARCSPLPPTPTPTNTPTVTPIPSVTPSPTPSPSPTPERPPACTGLMPVSRLPVEGCGVAPDVARAEE